MGFSILVLYYVLGQVVLGLGVALAQYSYSWPNTIVLGHNTGPILKHPFNNPVILSLPEYYLKSLVQNYILLKTIFTNMNAITLYYF